MIKWKAIKLKFFVRSKRQATGYFVKCLVMDFCSIALGSCPVHIEISVVQNPVSQVSIKHQQSSDWQRLCYVTQHFRNRWKHQHNRIQDIEKEIKTFNQWGNMFLNRMWTILTFLIYFVYANLLVVQPLFFFNASVNQRNSKSITTYKRLTWIRENIAIKCTGGIRLESIVVTQCETVFPQCFGASKYNSINSEKHVIDHRWTCIFFILRSPFLLKLNSRCWCSEQQLVS